MNCHVIQFLKKMHFHLQAWCFALLLFEPFYEVAIEELMV